LRENCDDNRPLKNLQSDDGENYHLGPAERETRGREVLIHEKHKKTGYPGEKEESVSISRKGTKARKVEVEKKKQPIDQKKEWEYHH